MKPLTSAFFSAVIAAFSLAALTTSSFAQQSTTVTQQTTTETRVTRAPQPKSIVSTEIEFQPASTAGDLNVQMLREFNSVKDGDPKIATDIARNPEVVQNADYVGKHPALVAFLDKYPNARGEIVANPGNFVAPVAGSKWNSHEAAGIPRN